MNEEIIQKIAEALKVDAKQVETTLNLLSEGNTVPMIARYRKDVTGGLDEEQILYIQKQFDYQNKLKDRKEDVLRLIEQQGKLTDEIRKSVEEADKLSTVEDIYRPYADVDLEEYNWDSFGANQFDHISKQWENQIKGTKVLCCDVSPLLDIFIELENHQVIEVYSDSSSRDSELWRLFEHGAAQHLVARDSGLQVE